ncbi:MAG: peptidyl-prolyl cis-trans isomerase, partial [Armatimonadetes bacterium]|nr:peptidyl-prolyl cis-trans isomerase [Armatimonadota bacterium]
EVSNEEIARYYAAHRKQFSHGPRVRARMMLFQSRESAEAVMTALKAGGDFAGLAKALSEDPATASDGGDMGWFEAGDYAAPISKMAFSLKPGEISPVFQGPDGWCILKLESKQPAGVEPLEKVAGRIRARLVQERMLMARAEWLKERRKQAKIAIDDPRLERAVRAQLETTPPAPALPGLMTPDQMILSPSGTSNPGAGTRP